MQSITISRPNSFIMETHPLPYPLWKIETSFPESHSPFHFLLFLFHLFFKWLSIWRHRLHSCTFHVLLVQSHIGSHHTIKATSDLHVAKSKGILQSSFDLITFSTFKLSLQLAFVIPDCSVSQMVLLLF